MHVSGVGTRFPSRLREVCSPGRLLCACSVRWTRENRRAGVWWRDCIVDFMIACLRVVRLSGLM